MGAAKWLRNLGFEVVERPAISLEANPRYPARPWTYDEITNLCGVYFTIPFGKIHARNPQIQRIADALKRNANSVAMKLLNLAALDPELRTSGRTGLTRASRLDRRAWEDFYNNREAASAEVETWITAINDHSPGDIQESEEIPAIMEVETSRKVRRAQGYFRRMILALYSGRCCMTDICVPELLVASHILPWARFPEARIERGNGLCLATHFDHAFDRGLITFDDQLRLTIGRRLRACDTNPTIVQEFLRREGSHLAINRYLPPNPDYLAWHRNEIFDR